jgi:uncharacterized protein (DUF2147 family)
MRVTAGAIAMSLITALVAPACADAAEPVAGRWVTQNKKAMIQIEPCGRGMMCGRIVKLLPAADYGKTVDERNNDPKQRHRPLVGLPLLLDFTDGGDKWRGNLYDPQSGDTYTATLDRYPDGALKVRGCFFIICKTQRWPKAD